MNRKIHLILLLGCVIIAVLDAPRASRLFSEGLAGPYDESARLRSGAVETPTPKRAGPTTPSADDARLGLEASKAPVSPNAALLNSSIRLENDGDAAR
ncbi:MAG: hypothetical protein K8S98_06895 [Planctomycetes bacterium]|nr:hypothetical protein [Planctomycetota bacterium]